MGGEWHGLPLYNVNYQKLDSCIRISESFRSGLGVTGVLEGKKSYGSATMLLLCSIFVTYNL